MGNDDKLRSVKIENPFFCNIKNVTSSSQYVMSMMEVRLDNHNFIDPVAANNHKETERATDVNSKADDGRCIFFKASYCTSAGYVFSSNRPLTDIPDK